MRSSGPTRRWIPPRGCKGARWVEPEIVIRVEFAEWTADDLLRQAAYKGLEPDKDAARRPARARGPDARRATAAAERDPCSGSRRWPSQPSDRHDRRARGLEKEGIWVVDGREIRVTNLDKVLFPGRDGETPVTKRDLLRYHVAGRPDPRAIPRRPRADRPALPERGRAEGLLAEGLPATRRLDQALDVPPPRGGPEGVRRRRLGRDAGLAGAGGGDRAPPLDEPDRCARPAALRPHRHRSRAGHDLGGGPRRWRACIGRRSSTSACAGYPKVTGKRGIQVWIGIEPGPTFDETRDWVEGISRAVGAIGARPRQLGVGEARAEGQGAARLHPERDQQDPRRAVQRRARRPVPR